MLFSFAHAQYITSADGESIVADAAINAPLKNFARDSKLGAGQKRRSRQERFSSSLVFSCLGAVMSFSL
ncbi:MAG: hypothetical protein QME32_01970 [Endomicrobiia bacterium]|nr:hypothetical protein [Endomicrobiia bacterium]